MKEEMKIATRQSYGEALKELGKELLKLYIGESLDTQEDLFPLQIY